MSQSSNRWLVVLLCVNAVLITAIIYHNVGLPRAAAQGQSGNYVMLPVRNRDDEEQLCLIDLAGQRMTTCRYDKGRRQIVFTPVLDMRLASEELQGGVQAR